MNKIRNEKGEWITVHTSDGARRRLLLQQYRLWMNRFLRYGRTRSESRDLKRPSFSLRECWVNLRRAALQLGLQSEIELLEKDSPTLRAYSEADDAARNIEIEDAATEEPVAA